MTRPTTLRLALLGAIAALPAAAQLSPATPEPDRPAAATEGGARPREAAPATPPRDDTVTGTTSPMRGATGGQGASLGPLEHGANSFTESQARSRLEAAGFSNVQALSKDDSGIWRGRAMRGGRQVEVGLDYRGTAAELR